MQIVIDIPKDVYKETLRTEIWNEYEKRAIRFAIRNCTILPKGHGRLIDADAVMRELSVVSSRPVKSQIYMIKQAPTIIDTDKTESEL